MNVAVSFMSSKYQESCSHRSSFLDFFRPLCSYSSAQRLNRTLPVNNHIQRCQTQQVPTTSSTHLSLSRSSRTNSSRFHIAAELITSQRSDSRPPTAVASRSQRESLCFSSDAIIVGLSVSGAGALPSWAPIGSRWALIISAKKKAKENKQYADAARCLWWETQVFY